MNKYYINYFSYIVMFFHKLITNKYINYRYLIKYNINSISNIKNKDFIQNKNVPICKKCIYIIKSDIFDNDLVFSKCKLFGYKDIINGKIIYKFTSTCRDSEKYCGVNGKYYEN